jgi:fatty-acyl-CoA synthase
MAAVQLRPEADRLDPGALAQFLADQSDLGTKWAPRFVRMSRALPLTATNKVIKRQLRAERWNCAEPVLWRSVQGSVYQPLTHADAATLESAVGHRVL